MFSMFACCAAPAKAGGVEVVPVRKAGVFDDPSARLETFDLTEAEAPKKKGLSYDSQDSASVSTRCSSRFDRHERRLAAPAWESDVMYQSWSPEISRNWQAMTSPWETSCPRDGANKEERLKQLVAEFRPTLARGVRVNIIDASTQLFCQCVLRLDMAEQTITLTMAFADERSFDVKDMVSVYKGSEFTRKHPDLAHASSTSVGMDFQSGDESGETTILHFEDSCARNDFYAFIKIARMAADNVQTFEAFKAGL